MKPKRGMRARLLKQEAVGTITNVRERGVAGSNVTYITLIEITYSTGLVIKCEPSACVLVDDVPQ